MCLLHLRKCLIQLESSEKEVSISQAGDSVVRLCPPLVVTADEIDTCVRILGEAVADVEKDPKGAYNEARRWMQIDDGEVDG